MKLIGLSLVLASLAATAFAGTPSGVPEIDGSMAASAVTLLAGGMLVVRSRKK